MKESPSTARARVLKWQRENHDAYMKKQRAYRSRHPERYKARLAVLSALRNGALVRPATCRCGKSKPEAHHEDYNKPLEVTWLCKACHLKEHGGRLLQQEDVHKGERMRDRMGRFVTVASVVALLSVGSATASTSDDYGTTRAEAARMTALVHKTFGTGWQGRCMVRIMFRESGGNPRAANYRDTAGGSYGLMQLNGVHRWRGESLAQFRQRMWNPASHLAAAKRLYDGSGFGPWKGC